MLNKWPGVVQCLQCTEVLVSNFRHDFITCQCDQQTFVDGGRDYLRYGGKDVKKVQVLKLTKARKK